MMQIYEIRTIPEKGLGLVATKDIAAGTLIVRSILIRLSSKDWCVADGTTFGQYVYTQIKGDEKTHYLCLGDAALINHSYKPNVSKEIVEEKDRAFVFLRAAREISIGEELFISYANPKYYDL